MNEAPEMIELLCSSGHRTRLPSTGAWGRRQMWCAKCGADLIMPPAEDAPVETRRKGSGGSAAKGLRSVPDEDQS